MAQEIEAKFYVNKLGELQKRLEGLGAGLADPRVLELNLRFDTPNRDLKRLQRVFRLRRDTRARLTYKDSDRAEASALNRRELEFTVSDFDEARDMLEALGYQVVFIYEKYRTTYKLDKTEIMLDEMPYGHFVEIESKGGSLRPVADKLKLNWDAAIPENYSMLFDRLKERRNLPFRDLTFANFSGLQVSAADLSVRAADE